MHITKFLLLGVVLVSVVAVIFFGSRHWTNETELLNPVEIKEYEGQMLSSTRDFRENSIEGPQYIDNESYSLIVTGLVSNVKVYSYADVINTHEHYKKVVTLHCVDGWDVTILWEGVLVKDLLEEAGVNPEAKVVIFYAFDNYSTSLPLDYVIDNDIIMACKMNGLTLPPERGFPFQLVAESKQGYKWIKWITKIELSDDVDYRGYWESRGFSHEADIPQEDDRQEEDGGPSFTP